MSIILVYHILCTNYISPAFNIPFSWFVFRSSTDYDDVVVVAIAVAVAVVVTVVVSVVNTATNVHCKWIVFCKGSNSFGCVELTSKGTHAFNFFTWKEYRVQFSLSTANKPHVIAHMNTHRLSWLYAVHTRANETPLIPPACIPWGMLGNYNRKWRNCITVHLSFGCLESYE